MTTNTTRVGLSFTPITTTGATSALEVARGKQCGRGIAWWHPLTQNHWRAAHQFQQSRLGYWEHKNISCFFAVTKGLNSFFVLCFNFSHCFNFSFSSLPLFLFCGFVVETCTRKIISTIRRLFGEPAEVLVFCKATLTLNCWISHKYRIWLLIPSFPSSPLQCDSLKNQNNAGNPWSVRPWWDDADYCCVTVIYTVP